MKNMLEEQTDLNVPYFAQPISPLEAMNTSGSPTRPLMRTRNRGNKVQIVEDSPTRAQAKECATFSLRESGAAVKNDASITSIKVDSNPMRRHFSVQESRTSEAPKLVHLQSLNEASENAQNMVKRPSTSVFSEMTMKPKKTGQNQFEDCLKTYQKMYWFDWDLKDIVSSRHSPRDDLTTGAIWFYFNSTFFPHDLQHKVTQMGFEEWVQPIVARLNTFRVNQNVSTDKLITANNKIKYQSKLLDQLNQQIFYINDDDDVDSEDMERQMIMQQAPKKDQGNPDQAAESQNSVQMPTQLTEEQREQLVSHVNKLVGKRRKFSRFKRHYQDLQQRATSFQFDEDEMRIITKEALEIPAGRKQQKDLLEDEVMGIEQEEKNADEEIAEIKEKLKRQDFQKMVSMAEKDLVSLQNENFQVLKDLFEGVRKKFNDALEMKTDDPNFKDLNLYKGEEAQLYSQDFLARIDPGFVQDMVKNAEWYAQNYNEFLMNINYPCKLQTDFLKMIELSQQRRNDQKYRKILDQMDQMESMMAQEGMDEAKRNALERDIQQLSMHQRAQIAQEDACCAICGVGDYEDDDQIVFCEQCRMPVHQSCFGLETIPEIDWLCNNCITFGFQKGLMVKCLLCPKRGGAMKPTNIFQSKEKYFEQKIKNLAKKGGKGQMIEKSQLAALRQQQEKEEGQSTDINNENAYSKQEILARLENNSSLQELLIREITYKDKTLKEYDDRLIQIEIAKNQGLQKIPELTESMKVIHDQEAFELKYNKHEKQNHNIPEDYSNFIKRNEAQLELRTTPVTDTLYHWVHHSCSMWMQGPIVTPRTPVKMNKMDFSKFNQGCVICGKRGCQVGACVKCCKNDCNIFFHVECAKRASYCMEIEKKQGSHNRERIFKIYCESHRPFKIIQEINNQNQKEVEDIQKFTKTIEKAMELQIRHSLKPKKLITKAEKIKMLRQALHYKKVELQQIKKESKLQSKPKKEKKEKPAKAKKWREIDKKNLLNRVKEKYLKIMRMRLNLICIDPMIAEHKRYQREVRRIQKQEEKRRKYEQHQKQQQLIRDNLKERENHAQERGLRNRIKPEEGFSSNFDDDGTFEKRNEIENMEDDELHTNEQLNQEHFNNEVSGSRITNNKITLNLQPDPEEENDSSMTPLRDLENMTELPELREIPSYFKFAAHPCLSELEWTVTLSRNDFPWNEICFEPFTARDCYKMYRSIVIDADSFLKKVLGEKLKYQRMMQNQIQGLPTFDTIMNMQLSVQKPKKEESAGLGLVKKNSTYKNSKQSKKEKEDRKQQSYGSIMPLNDAGVNNPNIYCKCKGYIQHEFMVACESGEDNCVNGGWLHPQCTNDLCNLTQEEIDQIEIWFCEDCIEQQNKARHNDLILQSQSQRSQQAPKPIFYTEQTHEFNISLSVENQSKEKKARIESSYNQQSPSKEKSLIVSIERPRDLNPEERVPSKRQSGAILTIETNPHGDPIRQRPQFSQQQYIHSQQHLSSQQEHFSQPQIQAQPMDILNNLLRHVAVSIQAQQQQQHSQMSFFDQQYGNQHHQSSQPYDNSYMMNNRQQQQRQIQQPTQAQMSQAQLEQIQILMSMLSNQQQHNQQHQK